MFKNPALAALAASIQTELVFGQVWIRRVERGFELRHVADKQGEPAPLQLLDETGLRAWAQFTREGAFRPLKSAPNLRSGWRILPRDDEALGAALNKIYPGAVADWFAAQTPQPPVTNYREFTARQTGMYRITTFLDDAAAGAGIRACCHKDFCLKRRLWSVEGLAVDPAEGKSAMPCLEPCAIMLEFARKIARLEQDEKMQRSSNSAEKPAVQTVAESDFDHPNNPRRLRFVLEKGGATSKLPVG